MKRICSVVIIFMLIIGMAGYAWAYDDEIVWQEIPWESKREDVLRILKKSKWISSNEDTRTFSFIDIMNYGMGYPSFVDEELSLSDTYDIFSENQKDIQILVVWQPRNKIAGYDVRFLEFTFSPEDKLLAVGVNLEVPNGADAAYEDLLVKQERIYGTGDAFDSGCRFTGTNETAVILTQQYGYSSPFLAYGKTNWKEMIGLEILAGKEADTIDPSDDSGL